MAAARKIYYLSTKQNTYEQRHDLFNTGVRWDSKHRRWWSTRRPPVKRAMAMVGGDAKIVATEVTTLPKIAATHRGGRPRAPRGSRKQRAAVAHRQHLQVVREDNNAQTIAAAIAKDDGLLVAVGGPVVRRFTGQDRRAGVPDRRASDRRGPNRPDAVMLIPMVEEATKQQSA